MCATCTHILYTIFGEQTAQWGTLSAFPTFLPLIDGMIEDYILIIECSPKNGILMVWLSFLFIRFLLDLKTTTSFEVVLGFANLLQMINSLSLDLFLWFVSFVLDFWYRALFKGTLFVTAYQRFQRISLTLPKSPCYVALATSRW